MRRAQLAALGLCALAWAACGRASPPPEPRFPWELVRGMLDAAPEEAQGRLLERFPDSRREEGSFSRYQVLGSEVLDEVTLFRDIRSGRVNAVIVKYKADLSPQDRGAALEELGVPTLARRLEGEEVVEAPLGPLQVRARGADRFGRLTITVEAAPEPAAAP